MPNPINQKAKEKGAIEIRDGEPLPVNLRLPSESIQLTQAQYAKLRRIAAKRKQSILQVIGSWIENYQLDPLPWWGTEKKNERTPIG